MTNLLKLSFRVSLVFILMVISSKTFSQATEGSLTFKVTTSSYNGNYSPKHVLSIWIEDANGFVKTSKLNGDRRKKYLYTWTNRSSGNTVDAVTGSTLSSHRSHTITWNGTDLNGNIVPDGDYKVRVEFTEQHAQGPLYALTFTKGADTVSITPADESRYKNISLAWEPTVAEPPEAAFSYITEDLTVTFTNSSVNADSYSWNFGDSQTSSEMNPVHTYAGAGTYTVVLEAVAGDSIDSSEQQVTVTASTLGFSYNERMISVYPIPAEHQLIVDLNGETFISGYEIVSLDGRKLRDINIYRANRVIIGIDDLDNGSYLLILKSQLDDVVLRFLKQ